MGVCFTLEGGLVVIGILFALMVLCLLGYFFIVDDIDEEQSEEMTNDKGRCGGTSDEQGV